MANEAWHVMPLTHWKSIWLSFALCGVFLTSLQWYGVGFLCKQNIIKLWKNIFVMGFLLYWKRRLDVIFATFLARFLLAQIFKNTKKTKTNKDSIKRFVVCRCYASALWRPDRSHVLLRRIETERKGNHQANSRVLQRDPSIKSTLPIVHCY